ncbi:hypothetical protein Bbelb_021050 [Branchiostoma belcheri]|nr:hypothetical protein Bbelb_021050 [Branchiostoma belcheri]
MTTATRTTIAFQASTPPSSRPELSRSPQEPSQPAAVTVIAAVFSTNAYFDNEMKKGKHISLPPHQRPLSHQPLPLSLSPQPPLSAQETSPPLSPLFSAVLGDITSFEKTNKSRSYRRRLSDYRHKNHCRYRLLGDIAALVAPWIIAVAAFASRTFTPLSPLLPQSSAPSIPLKKKASRSCRHHISKHRFNNRCRYRLLGDIAGLSLNQPLSPQQKSQPLLP